MIETIYLSRKNLEILLSKLNRQLDGEKSECTLIKYKKPNTNFCQTMDICNVVAVENSVYYKDQGITPGMMHPLDEIKVNTDYSSY